MPTIKCVLLGEEKRPVVAAWVNALNNRPISILFLIDTGSDRSIISTRDAKKLGFDLNELPPPPKSLVGIGGEVPKEELGMLRGENMGIKFMSTNGWYDVVIDNKFIVLKNANGYKLPSVLGVDFLREYSFKFHIDYSKNCVEFGNWLCGSRK
jgi:hypothetical protein